MTGLRVSWVDLSKRKAFGLGFLIMKTNHLPLTHGIMACHQPLKTKVIYIYIYIIPPATQKNT
jgi:hypothetical protein